MRLFAKHTLFITALLAVTTMYFGCTKGPNIKSYTYPPPVPKDMSPNSGYPGATNVTINGASFGDYVNVVKVFFNGIQADTVLSCTDGRIVVRVPNDAISGKVTLQIWNNTVDSIGSFTVEPLPTIKSADPLTGLPGDTVRIYGTNYGQDVTKVTASFNGTAANVVSVADTVITTTVPTGASSGNISIAVNGYPVTGPGFSILVAVGAPVYQLDFENNLIDKISGVAATYTQGLAQPLTYVAGIDGQAASLQGYSATSWTNAQSIQIPVAIAKQEEMTVSCWINWATGRTYDPIFDFGEARGTRMVFMTKSSTSSSHLVGRFLLQNKTNLSATYDDELNGSQSVTPGTWTHVAFTISNANKEMKIYLNGVLIGTKAFSNTAADPGLININKAYIGAFSYGSGTEAAFGGLMDKFQVYNSVLTADQIYTLYYKK